MIEPNQQMYPLTKEEIQILGQSRWFQHLKEYLKLRTQQEMAQLTRQMTPEGLAEHNLRVGKVLAFQEIIEYPERNS